MSIVYGNTELGVNIGTNNVMPDINPAELKVSFTPPALAAGSSGTQIVHDASYEGSYEVTPSAQTQIIHTKGKRMTDDVVVNPIPSNWGLMTHDGSIITVS